MRRCCLLGALLLLCVCCVQAIPAHRGSVQVRQPDGTLLTLRLCGDEWLNFTTTADGYTVCQAKEGHYVYAQQENGLLTASALVAHDAACRTPEEQLFLSRTEKFLKPQMSAAMADAKHAVEQQEARRRSVARRGPYYNYENFRGLIILVQFNDREFSRSDFPQLLGDMVNKEGYTGYDDEVFTGSVRDYFDDNSNGMFLPQFDVVGPYTINYSQYDSKMGYNVANDGEHSDKKTYLDMVIASIDAADADVDYRRYDGDDDGYAELVFIIFAGNGSNFAGNDRRLWWPHRGTIYNTSDNSPVRRDGVGILNYATSVELYGYTAQPETVTIDGIGTICHEFSHVLGLPDFYDTDGEGSGGKSLDPGIWSLMAGGSYENRSRTPVGYSMYERYMVGFTRKLQTLNISGHYTLQPLHVGFSGYRLNTPEFDEFFVLENRQKEGFKWDAYLPGSGLLVHRVDLTATGLWRNNKVNVDPSNNHYELVRAGGSEHSGTAWDVFPGEGNVTILNSDTAPANLLTHDKKRCMVGMRHIAMTEDGNIVFDLERPDDPTGVDVLPQDAVDASADTPLYNLQGQRVTPGHKGLFIRGGKKVVF